MNTAAPDPSDHSIAQAFREYLPAAEHADTQCLMSNIVERARELDASVPASAVGGEEVSPEFTDSARGAIAWVLWHHQGASSPIGQPLRFALGMGAGEELPDWRIAEAKRYAEWAKATTADFHTAAAPVGGFVLSKESNEWWWQRTDHMNPEARDMVRELLRTMAPYPAAQSSDPGAGDWPEDFVHENGNYANTCHACQHTFIGHKRRITCKQCAQSSAKDGARVGETLPTWLLVLIGNYGFASANSNDVEKLHRWELLMDGIKAYRKEAATTGAGLVDGQCEWTFDDMWESACGVSWEFTNDGPAENNYRFCHGCGKPIKIVEAAIGREVGK